MSGLFLRTLREDPAGAESAQPPAARPRGVHPPRSAGHLPGCRFGMRSAPAGGDHRPRGDGRDRRQGCSSPHCCPRSPTRATGRWTGNYGDNIFGSRTERCWLPPQPDSRELFTPYRREDLTTNPYRIFPQYRCTRSRPSTRDGAVRGPACSSRGSSHEGLCSLRHRQRAGWTRGYQLHGTPGDLRTGSASPSSSPRWRGR